MGDAIGNVGYRWSVLPSMTRIAIFGGTGFAGGNIAVEALGRGHEVISYTRRLPRDTVEGVDYRVGSLASAADLDTAAADADIVVVAVHATALEDGLAAHVPAIRDAMIAHGARVGFVGGAASSFVAEGGPSLLDTPDFREEWKPEATAHAEVLDALQSEPEPLDWFYVSPAALFGAVAPGETTGAYRIGGDILVTKEDGSSEISGTDFALAFVDEIENKTHRRRRFTVGH